MRARWLFALVVALMALVGCEVVLGLGELSTQGADGGVDSTVGPGVDSSSRDGGVDTSPLCASGTEPCVDGLNNCGEGGTESCATSLEVEGGTFYRAYESDGPDGGATDAGDPATVSAFRLDKYLVTVGRFRRFVDALDGGYAPDVGSGKHTHLNGGLGLESGGYDAGYEQGWSSGYDTDIDLKDLGSCGASSTWTPSAQGQERLPINCVNWYEAYAFCIWDGGFLPSEAEWEYAAVGGSLELEYPWGSASPGNANQYAIYDCDYGDASGCTSSPSSGNIAPVGTASLGAGLWGQLDMAGEVAEWNLDWYATPYPVPCIDCAVLNPSGTADPRVTRGGNFTDTFSSTSLYSCLPATRGSLAPDMRGSRGTGFRCARVP